MKLNRITAVIAGTLLALAAATGSTQAQSKSPSPSPAGGVLESSVGAAVRPSQVMHIPAVGHQICEEFPSSPSKA
ncbi:MAG: hypothetical protein H0T17_04960 [Propionibacteriales bacterium]|nr:hypothetical protein [Propionibacteriales bacterium]